MSSCETGKRAPRLVSAQQPPLRKHSPHWVQERVPGHSESNDDLETYCSVFEL